MYFKDFFFKRMKRKPQTVTFEPSVDNFYNSTKTVSFTFYFFKCFA